MIVRPVLCKPFVGRRPELAYLRERRLEAGASRGGLVFIAGDAGLGKSRLIAEFCGALAYSRWRITYGPCREFGGRPYGPILDSLSAVDPSGEQPMAESKHQYFEAIVERFAKVSARRALVVVIEDLHWADAASLDLLAYLAAKLHRMRILLIASFRPDALHAGHPAAPGIESVGRAAQASRIDLAPLEGLELRTFIDEALSGFTLSVERRRAVALAGEGNPFYTEELLKNAVQEGEDLTGNENRRVPQSLRTALLERLRPLQETDREIVTQAAVIGRTFTLDLLAAVAGETPERLVSTLRRARDFQLIEELGPSVFRFRHGLTREAICGDFLRAELRPLHRRIALRLAEGERDERSIEELAYHWWAAGDDELCTHYNALAGDEARNVYAHEDAIAYYERALEPKSLDATAKGTLLEKIANVRLVLGMREETMAAYERAAEMYQTAGAFEREAICRVRVAMTEYTKQLRDTSAPLEAMLLRLDRNEYRARSRLHLGIAWLNVSLRYPSRAQAHLAAIDPRASEGATDVKVRYHNVAACVAMELGDVDAFRREQVAWRDAARAHGIGALAGVYYNGAKYFASFGLHDEARESIRQALRIARETRSPHAAECAHATAALCYILSGDLHGAREAVEAVPPTADNRVNIIFATAAATAIAIHTGDAALLEKWFDGFEATILASPEIEIGYGFAEVLVRRGRLKDAQALLHRVLPDCECVRGEVLTLLAIARYGAVADRARARAYLERASATGNNPERPALALFDAIVAREERPADAIDLARDAADGFAQFRMPLLEAAAAELGGETERALSLYRRCGASYDVERLEGVASPAVGHEQRDPQRAAEFAALSSREREIVVLAARGESNLEIARSLAISHKTVEKHLGSVFLKLGVSSRRALRAYV